jgi:hypothetical protein
MKTSTLQAIAEHHAEFPQSQADGVGQPEIQEASRALGVVFPDDYREFLTRYGGGHIGSYAIAGLRKWGFAANDDWNVVDQTMHFRSQKWPGTEQWAVFTNDGSGNPIGFDESGRVWLSDHDSCEIVGLELSFEDWVRCWALDLEEGTNDYFDRYDWPET